MWQPPSILNDDNGPRPVVMLTTSYPTKPNPIAGIFVRTLAETLRAQEHTVRVLTPYHPGAEQERGTDWVRFPGDRASPFHTNGLPELMESRDSRLALVPGALLALARRAHRVAEEFGPRTVWISHWAVPGLGYSVLATQLGYDALTVAHSGGTRLLVRLEARLGAALVHLVRRSKWIASCDEVASILNGWGASVLTSGLPVDVPPRMSRPPTSGPLQLGFLGRLEPVKGLDQLIVILADIDSDVVLHVGGEGRERDALSKLAVEYNVNVSFHGLVVGEAKAHFLSGLHGAVCPSVVLPNGRTEGLPTFVKEALAMGIPTLASAVGGLGEFDASGFTKTKDWATDLGPWLDSLRQIWRDQNDQQA